MPRILLAAALVLSATSAMAQTNGTMLQYFDWDSNGDGQHWNRVKNSSASWATKGITAFWLPPAYKGGAGASDVGYGVYDIWDLGEFNQKGSVRTRWGTKAEYIAAIDAAHAAGIQVYGDIVLNHKTSADLTEWTTGVRVDQNNRNTEYGGDVSLQTWTKFTFPGRLQADGTLKYNNFKWNWYHFDGVDYAQNLGADGCTNCRIYKFRGTGKAWDTGVSTEKGNYDYLMGADLDFAHPDVRSHLKTWGVWYTNTAKLDGFRIDATKHISASFFNEWLYHVRQSTGKTGAFAVSEYWSSDINELNNYVNSVNGTSNDKMSAFDVPLHARFQQAADANGGFDMGSLFNNTLVAAQPTRAATFVDNHDTLEGRALYSKVQDWFKPLAYASILLRQGGYPTVFLGDYEGVPGKVANHSWVIDKMLTGRKFHVYGVQNNYFDNSNVVGWTHEGNAAHWYGMAVLLNDNRSSAGSKWMKVGSGHANQCFNDVTGATTATVCADANGWGNFQVPAGKVTVWVRTGKFGRNSG
ncbi:alpha-amylase [Massilia glaciei]|uniref:Alpha-amylase n=2 Tax=Massilia glaciei TaxID=1524097 RepID=A0A2U2HMH3_9BURK|nr:alpha-amylase [Massilia glaciei]